MVTQFNLLFLFPLAHFWNRFETLRMSLQLRRHINLAPTDPHPPPNLPLQGNGVYGRNLAISLPFRGRVRVGVGKWITSGSARVKNLAHLSHVGVPDFLSGSDLIHLLQASNQCFIGHLFLISIDQNGAGP